MPGFNVNGIGGNLSTVDAESRFYASYSWEIPDLLTTVGKLLSIGGYISSSTPSIILKTAQLPSVSFEMIKAKGGAQDYKYAGKPTFDNIKITFYDTYKLADGLKRWSESVYNMQDGIRTANNYKTKMVINKYLMDRDVGGLTAAPQPQGNVRYELYGAWPQMIKESDLTYSEASIKTVDVTITFDHYIINETDK